MDTSHNLINKNDIDINQNELDFQTAFDKYWHTETTPQGQKRQWDIMWMCVYYACLNLCKKIYKNRNIIVENEKLYDNVNDSTAYIMTFIKKGVRPQKLSSYCYLRCIRYIDNPRTVWYDTHITQMPEDNYKEIDMEIEDNGEY